MPHEVFISYSEEDKVTANAICHALERQGIRCWIAPRDIKYGESWGAAIVEGLDASKVMVLVFSSTANVSPHVNREVQRAIDNGITVIPFRVENVEPTKTLEYYISALQWLDAVTPPIEQHIEKLIGRVRQILPPQDEPPKPAGQVKPPPLTVNQAARQSTLPPPLSRPVQQSLQQTSSTGAVAALILGIISVLMFCFFGFITGPIAIFLGMKELKAIDAGQSSPAQRGYAKMGVILGSIGTIISVLVYLIFFIAKAMGVKF
jgi:hypothetical protein